MDYVLSKKFNETFTMNWIGQEKLSGDTKDLYLPIDQPISGVTYISGITYTTDGIINDKQYLNLYFKFKNAGCISNLVPCDECWSDMLEIGALSGLTLNPLQPFDFQLYVYRIDDANTNPTDIYISNIVIDGLYQITEVDGIGTITDDNTEFILSPKDIYKVFSIDDFEVIVRGVTDNIDIKFRVTQNNGRNYSQWEPLTTANISTFRFNELRFAEVQYLITQIDSSSLSTVIYDIILLGEFQNVSANYLKNNRYGLREDCLTTYFNANPSQTTAFSCGIPSYSPDATTNTSSSNNAGYDLKMNFYTQGLSCYVYSTTTSEVNMENQTNQNDMWNPYETNKITELANKIANDINSIFAWKVDYHLTDPDEGGTDMSLHEYQLYNIVDVKTVKVLVPENKFPDNTVKMSKWNLDLLDTFEIHIIKDEFKNQFGIDRRPAENDIIFFCELNRLYRVKHAQVFREIMNAGIYWKVILEKYEQKANIRNLSQESETKIDNLTKNTTMDELFGPEVTEEQEKIANKDQTKPITNETIRHTIYKDVVINEDDLYNGNIDFADYYYNFKDSLGKVCVTYQKYDKVLEGSENRSFISWFNFNNKYDEDDPLSYKSATLHYYINDTKNFNLLNNYDETNKVGYRYWYHRNRIIFQINESYYQIDANLKTNIWYGLVINMDQRQETLSMQIYKRPGDYNIKMCNPDTFELATITGITHGENLNNNPTYMYYSDFGFKPIDNQEVHNISTVFELLYSAEISITPLDFSHDESIKLIGSNIKYTNLRIFNEVIPEENINNILNQIIITDENKLILSDNSNRRLYADNFPKNKWD